MTTLYLDRRDTRLDLEGRALVLRVAGRREGSVPLHLLERVVMRTNVECGSALLARLAAAGVAITLFGGRGGRLQATLVGAAHNDAARRIGQMRRYDDADFRRRWSRRIVTGKVRGQRRLLVDALVRRPDLRQSLVKAIAAQEQALGRLRLDPPVDLATLRGIEGAAAAGFFRGYGALFAPDLGFRGRRRRPPPDPVNAALSLGYTLLHAEAVQQAHGAGLDPLIGFFHELDFGRASLACDLVEPLRPQVERWVWELFGRERLRPAHFQRDGDACLLGKEGRARFFAAYEVFARPRRRLLRRWTQRIARGLASAAPSAVSGADPMPETGGSDGT
ncbi:CRISPR-associated endonuclease Cas1 [Marichromatium gracile]|uniref:CRISPR-associated endonuclease Cas1 n=1 Tax=Marichromatium gracile TaxID=1048 RepID=A0A4R4AAL0_MARGR|nr:CRISPR-associated endonuclease Cas1 [Marichromatium gracile]MBK1708204.1 CRISPR-associated endonuclease Cas1 [Marichromatium gracile]TCW35885.1 CRISPR-associated Cas1 family protein [Marichromatium gracile]